MVRPKSNTKKSQADKKERRNRRGKNINKLRNDKDIMSVSFFLSTMRNCF
jgi:hypothetical protein